MKKCATVLTAMILTLLLWLGSAFAYTIDDTTDVHEGDSWRDYFVGWVDVVGDPGIFNTYGINVSWSSDRITFDLFTEYSGETFGGLIEVADLALDLDQNGTYEYGIDLSGGDAGLYHNPSSWRTSYDVIENQNDGAPHYRYGEGYVNSEGNEVNPPVAMVGGTLVGNIGFSAIAYDGEKWSVSFDSSLIPGISPDLKDGFNLFWGTATCANDAIAGTVAPVPEPATMLLFGVGLIGMVGLGRKKFLKR